MTAVIVLAPALMALTPTPADPGARVDVEANLSDIDYLGGWESGAGGSGAGGSGGASSASGGSGGSDGSSASTGSVGEGNSDANTPKDPCGADAVYPWLCGGYRSEESYQYVNSWGDENVGWTAFSHQQFSSGVRVITVSMEWSYSLLVAVNLIDLGKFEATVTRKNTAPDSASGEAGQWVLFKHRPWVTQKNISTKISWIDSNGVWQGRGTPSSGYVQFVSGIEWLHTVS